MATLPKLTDFEYRSKVEVNGWPMIHVNLGTNLDTGRPRVAKGVVAIGNIALGVVSIGAAAFGVVALGAFGLGVVSLAALAIGIVALGAVAWGYALAFGAVVQAGEMAVGVSSLDVRFAAWSLILVATIALALWVLGKVKATRLQS